MQSRTLIAIFSIGLITLPSWAGNPVVAPNEACTLGSLYARADIESLSAGFDQAAGTISVQMRLCSPPIPRDKRTSYRVHFVYEPRFLDGRDPIGSMTGPAGDDEMCADNSDKMMMRHWKKDIGPGTIVIDPADEEGRTLTFSVALSEFGPASNLSHLFIYSETHLNGGSFGGVVDRAPNTDVTDYDQCALPQTIGEVLDLTLSEPALSCPCWAGLTTSDLIAYLEAIPPEAIETVNRSCVVGTDFGQLLFQDQGDGMPTVLAQAFVVGSSGMCDRMKFGESTGFDVTTLTISPDQASRCVEEVGLILPRVSWCQ
jgi:hypothetical protein